MKIYLAEDIIELSQRNFETAKNGLLTIPKSKDWKLLRYFWPLYGRFQEPYWLGKSEYENFRVGMSTLLTSGSQQVLVTTVGLYEYPHEYDVLLYDRENKLNI